MPPMPALVSTARPSLRDSMSGQAFDLECVFNILQNKCDRDAHYASPMKLLRREVMLRLGKVVEPSVRSTNTEKVDFFNDREEYVVCYAPSDSLRETIQSFLLFQALCFVP
jgi:hypothetical protein